MNLKKFFCGAVAASIIFSASIFSPVSAEESANAKLARIEIDTYGTEQSGAILDRISRLEKSYNGENMEGNMNARIEAIYDTLYDNSADIGILAKVNVLEWNINHEVSSGGIDIRLVALENQILGTTNEGTFNERIRELAKASYGEEILPINQVQIPENTLIKVATTTPVGSKSLHEGDNITLKVVEDVFVNGNLVFTKGLPGEGIVVTVRRAKNIFSNGKIEIDFHKLKSLDGQEIKTLAGVEAVEMMSKNSMSRGLSLVGQTFSGKNSGIEEVFIRGKNIDLPAGVELYIQTKEPVIVYGLRVKNADSIPVIETPTYEPYNEQPAIEQEPIAPPPAPENYPESEPTIEESKPAPPDAPDVEPRRDEGKTLEGYEGEIIEIIEEE